MPIHLFPVCGSLATLRSFDPVILGDNSTGRLGVSPALRPRILPRHYGLEELLEQLSPEPGVVPYSVQEPTKVSRWDKCSDKPSQSSRNRGCAIPLPAGVVQPGGK
ncbi:hypothetical protein B0H14DRAFT_3144060 [Mycena olivaceomarginata]|nr:hypothetical protein B0H14DRAFT_3144060 [Mycena olivaceomarginata]